MTGPSMPSLKETSEGNASMAPTNVTVPTDSPATSFMQQMRSILHEMELSGDIQGLRVRWLDALGSLREKDLNDVQLKECLTASTAVKEVLDQPRNRFVRTQMGDDTMLALFSPNDRVTIRSCRSGSHAIQYFHVPNSPDLPETAARVLKSSEEHIPEIAQNQLLPNISRFMRTGYVLERVSRTTFSSITIPPRHLMLILSCTDPITVSDIQGQESSVLIAGRMPRSGIEAIARVLDVAFDTDQRWRLSNTTSVDCPTFSQGRTVATLGLDIGTMM